MSLALYLYVRRYYPVDYEWGRVGIILGIVILLLAANFMLLDYRDLSIGAAVIRLGILAGYPGLLVAAGFFSGGELDRMRRFLGTFVRRGK